MIFVDTSAWFASVVQTDTDYQRASQWLSQNPLPLLTTDYIIDETLTLLRMRGEHQKAIALGDTFFSGRLATIYYLNETDIKQTWQVFRTFSDKNWSFTDSSSKIIMEKQQITHAFAFDHHFQQFGSITVVP